MKDDAEDREKESTEKESTEKESTEKESTEKVTLLAQRLRQSLQVCSTHTGGPLAAYSDCVLAVRTGKVSYADFRNIGINLISSSKQSIDRARNMSDNSVANSRIAREERIIRFVSALFRGSDEELLKWQVDRPRIEGSSE